MNSAEMLEQLPDFFENYINGTSPVWTLPRVDDLNAGAWRFRVVDAPDALVVIKILGNEADEIRINVGLALDLPYTYQLAEFVNMLNNKQLIFGRMFILGDVPFIGDGGHGPCAVVMQEIVFGESLSFEFPPSLNHVLNLTARLAGQAHRFTPEILERFGGRAFQDDDDGVMLIF